MPAAYVIGIDIGTGSTKAIALGFDKNILKETQEFYPPHVLQSTEQNATIVFDCFKKCLKQIIACMGYSPAAISLSSAMHSLMAVDEKGEPLTPLMLWSDTRSAAIAEALRNSKEGKEIYKATGTPLHAASPLCKIKWLKENVPGVFNQAHKVISAKEFIWHKIFDVHEIDYSIASATGMLDIVSKKWYAPSLAFAGIKEEHLSKPVQTNFNRKGVTRTLATELGIEANTKFFIGGSDGCFANVGSLCLHPQQAAVTIGTSAAVRVTSLQPVIDEERMIFNYILDNENFVCGGAMNNGGNILEWLSDKFIAGKNGYAEIIQAIETIQAGSEGLIFLPHLHAERAPIWDEQSSGVYFGIKPHHTKAHFVKAAAEGICFGLKNILEGVEAKTRNTNQIIVSGGAAKLFAQMLADVMGKEVVFQNAADSSAAGAAYFALKELNVIYGYSALSLVNEKIYYPVAESFAIYQKLFSVYVMLYPDMKNAMHRLHKYNNH